MKPWLPGAAGGLALGVLGTYAYLSSSYEMELAKLRQEISAARESASQAEQSRTKIQDQLKTVEELNRQQLAKSLSAPSAGDSQNQDTAQPAQTRNQNPNREADMRAFAERMINRGVDRWTDALKLTPEQVFHLNQLIQAKIQNGQTENPWSSKYLQNELLEVLTPQQKAEYEHIQNRENQARVELRAQTQLSQVQSMFDLTDTQKDQIFQKFAEMEQTQAQPQSQASVPNTPESRREMRQAQTQKRIDALQGILTPDQIKQYQKAQEGFNGFNGFGGR